MDAALAAATEAVRVARANGELCWEAEALRALGEVKLAGGAHDGAEVEGDLGAAVAIAGPQQAKSFELRAMVSLARLWHGRGRPGEARNLLAPVYGWFSAGRDNVRPGPRSNVSSTAGRKPHAVMQPVLQICRVDFMGTQPPRVASTFGCRVEG